MVIFILQIQLFIEQYLASQLNTELLPTQQKNIEQPLGYQVIVFASAVVVKVR